MSSSFDRPYGFEEQFPAGRLAPPPVQGYGAGTRSLAGIGRHARRTAGRCCPGPR